MVMWKDFCQFLFLDRDCFRKMLGAKVVVEVNLELIAKEDWLELEVLLEKVVVLLYW